MFLEHFQLREQPFGVTPDPRFLCLGQSHREAIASLLYGITSGRGFMALIAEPPNAGLDPSARFAGFSGPGFRRARG